MLRLPLSIKRTRKCNRCGMRYPVGDAVCQHCEGLTDDQVRRLRLRHNRHLAGSSNLGRLLMYIAGLLLVIMVMYMLRRE